MIKTWEDVEPETCIPSAAIAEDTCEANELAEHINWFPGTLDTENRVAPKGTEMVLVTDTGVEVMTK